MNAKQLEIVTAARRHIGARWSHQGRADDKLDCAGLVIKVAQELGYIDWDVRDYARLERPSAMLDLCKQHLIPVPRKDLQPGDLVVLRYATTNHIGVIADYPLAPGLLSLIHASTSHPRRVGENQFNDAWMSLVGCQLAGCFRFPGVSDE